MVYFLKFGASWVLPPGVFIIALAALGIYSWKRRKERRVGGLLLALVFVFYAFCTSFVSEKAMGALEGAYEPPANPEGDVIIMLGGGAIADTPDVDGTGTLTAAPASRLLAAVRLQRRLSVPILLSGGQVYADSGAEAAIARRNLLSLGVPEEMILVETRSVNTTTNARYSAEILREKGLRRPILVTSAFHMRRAVLNFEKQGIPVVPFPADWRAPRHPVFHYTKLRPQADALLDNVTVLQEVLRTLVTRYLE